VELSILLVTGYYNLCALSLTARGSYQVVALNTNVQNSTVPLAIAYIPELYVKLFGAYFLCGVEKVEVSILLVVELLYNLSALSLAATIKQAKLS
jgi:hypothetical protein